MKVKFGTLLMVLGSVLLAAALALFLFNCHQQQQASRSVDELMPQMAEIIQERKASFAPVPQQPEQPEQPAEPEEPQMTVVEIDGHGYIGFLSIPSQGLDLPIMGDWSYPKLQIAPCRFTGSIKGRDLVLMAHNYNSHFGKISKLTAGDEVHFTDMDGNIYYYEVIAKDVVAPDAVEEVISGDFPLTLFTCTYGGRSRIVVYCERVAE